MNQVGIFIVSKSIYTSFSVSDAFLMQYDPSGPVGKVMTSPAFTFTSPPLVLTIPLPLMI